MLELLTVIAVMSVLTAMSLPVVSSIKDSQNVTLATSSVSSALQRARTYAMAHDTYVWVGFYEEAANTTKPTSVPPPYTSSGQLVIGMAASVDGTQLESATSGNLQAPLVSQIEKLQKLENVHCTDLGAPTGSGAALAMRPNGAYASATSPGVILPQEQFGINSDDTGEATHWLVLDGYTFYKTIRFSPSGEAVINDSSSLRRIGEIDLRPTHGTQVDANTPNVAAIQFSGIEGAIQTYRN